MISFIASLIQYKYYIELAEQFQAENLTLSTAPRHLFYATLPYGIEPLVETWSGHGDSNPRPSAWKAKSSPRRMAA